MFKNLSFRSFHFVVLFCCCFGLQSVSLAATIPSIELSAALSRLEKGGYVVVMRHELTVPGVGDPEGYSLDRCESQRNLSDEGRLNARRLGQRFAASQVRFETIRSSQWCRCQDTAALILSGMGETGVHQKRNQVWVVLNSFFERRETSSDQTIALRKFIGEQRNLKANNVLLVTHQVNISALTGFFPSSGQLIALKEAADQSFAFSLVK
jgi:broad specificity phosphatase PhoE